MQESYPPSESIESPQKELISTRSGAAPKDGMDFESPRLGRRESEPHSAEITYLYNILTSNFPSDHALWDLHHFFQVGDEEIDLQFDISYFRIFHLDFSLSSYRSSAYDNRVPTVVINILSKSTWRLDIGENVDMCRFLKIPFYVLFSPFVSTARLYHPPFLRVYRFKADGNYDMSEMRAIALVEGQKVNDLNLVSLGEMIPFRLGIMELDVKHEGGVKRYRLVLVEKDQPNIFLTVADQEKARADQEKARADQEKTRADQEKARADKEKARADALEQKMVQKQ